MYCDNKIIIIYVCILCGPMIVHTQRLAELVKEGKLSVDKSTGLLQPVSSDSCLPGRDASGEVPVSSFANYLHSHHEPVSIYRHVHVSRKCMHVST